MVLVFETNKHRLYPQYRHSNVLVLNFHPARLFSSSVCSIIRGHQKPHWRLARHTQGEFRKATIIWCRPLGMRHGTRDAKQEFVPSLWKWIRYFIKLSAMPAAMGTRNISCWNALIISTIQSTKPTSSSSAWKPKLNRKKCVKRSTK